MKSERLRLSISQVYYPRVVVISRRFSESYHGSLLNENYSHLFRKHSCQAIVNYHELKNTRFIERHREVRVMPLAALIFHSIGRAKSRLIIPDSN